MSALRAVQPPEDKRIRPGQCHELTMIGGSEFICIADPHPDQPLPKGWSLDRAILAAQSPLSRRHFFIRRYPPGGDS